MDWLGLIAAKAKTIAINSASASITVHSTPPGIFFTVLALFLEAEGAGDVTVRSGSNDLTGPIAFAANDEKEWKSDYGVFFGRAAGEDFILVNASTVQLNGFAVIVEGVRNE